MHNFNFKTFFYEVSKEILDKSEKIKKQKNIEKNINIDLFWWYNKYTKMQNPNWPQIPNHPYGILIIGRSKSGEANSLLNLINHQPDTDKMYQLYAKNPGDPKYQLLIDKR